MRIIFMAASVMMTAVSVAQTPASAPAGSTGMCRDGSYWTGATKKGACRDHKGVQDWHCPSDRWYGKTKSGAYMSEADAIAQGNHADHGKACSK